MADSNGIDLLGLVVVVPTLCLLFDMVLCSVPFLETVLFLELVSRVHVKLTSMAIEESHKKVEVDG